MRVGSWLLTERRTLKVNELAEALDVSRRTLLNWKRQIEKEQKIIGRPRYTAGTKFKALLQVGREWKKQEQPGWRPVEAVLRGNVPTRLVQQYVSRLKFLKRKKHMIILKARRISLSVKATNVYWVQDGTVYRQARHQIIKDRGSLKVLSVKRVKRERATGVVYQLDQLKAKRGLPLVLGTDNGSIYISSELQKYLEKNRVVHLRSLPRTPQHNGSIECAIREIKDVASQNACSLQMAAETLNKNRLRASFGFKSAVEMDDTMAGSYSDMDRLHFYNRCKAKIKIGCAGLKNAREKRMVERKMIFETLEEFGLANVVRGRLA